VWLTRLALRNPILILMMSLMVIALGGVALDRLSVDLFPNINIPTIRIATFYAGAAPGDIEKSITEPIERAVASSPGVDRVESVSKQGFSLVTVWFGYDVYLDAAQFDVSQRVSQILYALPPGIQQPFILKFDITNIPVANVTVSGEGLDERQLYDLTYNVIEPQLERLPGVASATVSGGKQREIEVMLDRELLRARGVGLLDVLNGVKTSNLILPSGDLRSGNQDYNVFTNTQVPEAKPLENVVVRPPALPTPGAAAAVAQAYLTQAAPAVRLADVGRVADAAQDQTEIVRINGRRGVFMRVLKQPNANTIAVVDALRAQLPKLVGMPPSVKLDINFDQSTYIRAAVKSLEHEAAQGGLLAMAVILVFLASLRSTAIIGVAIPLSIVATFILLYFSGQSLNVFTLGGLALGVGRLVDDSIVELENIHRHMALGHASARPQGSDAIENASARPQGSDAIMMMKREAVLAAAQEVAMPILVSTITTVIVFFPVLFLQGVAKNLFLPLALTITFALMMSFFVSRTVTPLLCLKWLEMGHGREPSRGLSGAVIRALDGLDHAYARLLGWVLRRRGLLIGSVLSVFVASLLLFKKVGTEFFPDSDESQISVTFKTPIGTRVEKTEQLAARLETDTKEALGDKVTVYLSDNGLPLGRTATFSQSTGQHFGVLNVNLVPPIARPMKDVQAAEMLRAKYGNQYPGTQFVFFVGGIVKRILNFGAPAPIDVEILGYDLEKGGEYAKLLKGKLRELADTAGAPLLTDVDVSREENYPQFDVVVDREKAGTLGISEQDVAQSVLMTLTGNTQFSPIPFVDPKTGNQYFVNIRMLDAFRSHLEDLHDIILRAPSGSLVPIDSVASITRSSGPVLISRKYLQRVVDVTANVAPGKDLGTASVAVQRVLDDTPPPDGYTARLGGQTLEQKKAFAGLAFAALMALALVYMVLASQFKSLLDPLIIMFSVPMGITGVAVMLWATKTTLSVNSAMGIIMMVGIVVSNGVLLVDFANVLRRRGEPIMEATVKAARTRLRPILMTTIATIVGLLPMALGVGEESETNMPLARAVIGGLTVSTFFTLFLVPSLYMTLDRFAKRAEEQPA
jgi:multidrug efflux pump subunit AcrB